MRISDWSSDVCSSDLLAVVAGDVGLEACDAVFELAALGSVQVPADGAEVVERLSRLVESPLGALAVVLLAGERSGDLAVLPGRVDWSLADATEDLGTFTTKLLERDPARLDLVDGHALGSTPPDDTSHRVERIEVDLVGVTLLDALVVGDDEQLVAVAPSGERGDRKSTRLNSSH